MKAVNNDKFKASMTEELDAMYENKIYGIIKKIYVREGYSLLRSVWSHHRKTTPDGVIYRHRLRPFADKSTIFLDYTILKSIHQLSCGSHYIICSYLIRHVDGYPER